jgi:hypothetical protein
MKGFYRLMVVFKDEDTGKVSKPYQGHSRYGSSSERKSLYHNAIWNASFQYSYDSSRNVDYDKGYIPDEYKVISEQWIYYSKGKDVKTKNPLKKGDKHKIRKDFRESRTKYEKFEGSYETKAMRKAYYKSNKNKTKSEIVRENAILRERIRFLEKEKKIRKNYRK